MIKKDKSIAVMQPYVFPYLGYFKMIESVSCFILYDNVQYINRGFINRNKILINGEPKYFNFQIDKNDQFKKINKVKLKDYLKAKEKFLNQLFFSYKRAPYFKETYEFIDFVLNKNFKYIGDLNYVTLKQLSKKLDLGTDFIQSSEMILHDFDLLNKEQKLDLIIERQNAQFIMMPPSSKELYKDWSPVIGCTKQTLELENFQYKQFTDEFVGQLSIIDVLMFNGFEQTTKVLKSNERV